MTDNPAQSLDAYHPAVAGVLQFFEADHLPEGPIRDMSLMFRSMAYGAANRVEPHPELTVALRKLLESKDAAVRAVVIQEKARRGVKTIVNPSEFRDGPR